MKKAFLQLHFAVLLAGLTGILGRLITLNEGLLVWYRLLFSTATLLIIFRIRNNSAIPSRKLIWKMSGVGAIIAFHWVMFYAGIKFSNVSVALVCFSSIGFFTAVIEPLILRVKFDRRELGLGLLMIAGISFIFRFDPLYKIGIITSLIAAVTASIFPVLNRKILKEVPAFTVTLFELGSGFLFLTLLLPVYLKWSPADHYLPTIHDLFWLLVLAWLCTVFAFNLSMKALEKISAFTVNLTYNLEPVYGIILAFLVYREDKFFGPDFYTGLVLILLAMAGHTLILYSKYRRRPFKDKAINILAKAD